MSFWSTDVDKKKGFLKEAKENLLLLEGQLKGKKFFGGDAIGLVDIAASGLAHWLGVFEEITGVTLVTDEEFPALCQWAKGYVNDDTVNQCLRNRDELVTMFSACKEMFRAMATLQK